MLSIAIEKLFLKGVNYMASSVTLDEIAELLLQILQHTKESSIATNIINEHLLSIEDVCEKTGFKERLYS